MTDYKTFLTKFHQNLNTLREREANYGGNAPLELLNQINDHQQAIALTGQALTLYDIADRLNTMGIPTRSKKFPWHKVTIRGILTEIVTGNATYPAFRLNW